MHLLNRDWPVARRTQQPVVPSHPAPQEYPQPEKEASTNRKDDGNEEVNKEGEEGPGDKGDDHDTEEDHVGAEPRHEEGSSVEHCPEKEEEGEEEMEHPGEKEPAKQRLVMDVEPVEATGDSLGHLSVPMVLHQPPLDRLVDMVPGAGVDQQKNGWQDDCESKYEGENCRPKDKSTSRIVTIDPSNTIF